MKNFLFSSEILPPLNEFFYVCIFAWENLSIYASQYMPAVPDPGKRDSTCAHIIVTQWFIRINESDESFVLMFDWRLFYDITTKGQWKDMIFLNRLSLLSWSQHEPPADIRTVCFVDMSPGRKWHSVVFSNSISGIHSGGSPLVHYY